MRRNFELSAVLAALGAVIVVVALFFEWYEPGLSAWDAFEIVDWALLALALVALGTLAAETFGASAPSGRLPWIAAAIGFLVLAEIIDAPPAAAGDERAIGAWLALAGVVLLAAGVILALMRISVTIDVADRERRRRTSAVDARAGAREEPAGDDDAVTEAPAGATGLWKRPGEDESKGRVEGEARTDSSVSDGPAEDPDRTQPLPSAEKPREDG